MRYRPAARAPTAPQAEREAQHRQQRADNAATRAQAMLKQAEWAEHPYLQRKALGTRRVSGYRNDGPKGFVLDDALLIPMRSLRTGEVRAVQAIQPDGTRKFLPLRVRSSAECIHTIGPRGRVCWWVEGFATGLAVREALDAIYRQADRVVCCFSSGQLAKLPQQFSKLTSFVVADADWWRCPERPPMGRAGRRLSRMRRTRFATSGRQGRSGYGVAVVGARQARHRRLGLRGAVRSGHAGA